MSTKRGLHFLVFIAMLLKGEDEMSQEKVERYKKEKANRKETIKKEKRNALIAKTAVSLVLVATIGWIGYSAYGVIQSNKPVKVVDVNLDSVNGYLAELSTDSSQ